MRNIYITLLLLLGIQAVTAQSCYPDQVPIVASKAYLGKKGKVKLTIKCAPGHSGIQKPLIVAEGFDVGTLMMPEEKNGLNTYDVFQNSILGSNSTALQNLIGDTYSRQYDIVYVDWDNGVDYMQRNGYALEEVINWVNQKKALAGSMEPNVIIGQSMGGVIARYALADMEEHSLDHQTRLFVSHDSPQQGANVPVSVQYMYRHIKNLYMETSQTLGGVLVTMPIAEIGFDLSSQYLSLLDTPAAKQLLPVRANLDYSIDLSQGNPSNFFYNVLKLKGTPNSGGYPVNCVNVAISDGSECGNSQGYNPGDDLINYNYNNGLSFWQDWAAMALSPMGGIYGGFFINKKLFGIGAVGFIPGGSRFKAEINAKALYNNTTDQIYKGRLCYEKKILWLVPVTVCLTDVSKPQPAGLLPMDTYGGGVYEMGNITGSGVSLPDGLSMKDGFNFIPTVSALDIGKRNTNAVLTDADYKMAYVGATPPAAPKNSPFSNFTTDFEPSNPNAGNKPHISFDTRNGDWLAKQLNPQLSLPSTTNCSFICSDDVQISGNDRMCSSGTYSFLAGMTSYNWTVDGTNLVTWTGNHTNTITLNQVGTNSGYVTISLSFGSQYCGGKTLTKTIWVGKPVLPLYPVPANYIEALKKTSYGSGGWNGSTKTSTYNYLELTVPQSIIADQGITAISWTKINNTNTNCSYDSTVRNMGILKTWNNFGTMPTYADVSQDAYKDWGIAINIKLTNSCGYTDTTANYCWNGIDTSGLDPHWTPDPDGPGMGKKVSTSNESTETLPLTDNIKLYPNPSNGVFNIDLTSVTGEYDMIKVYDMLGALVYENGLDSKSLNQINLSNISTGQYIAKVSGKSGVSSFQLIKY